MVFSELHAWLIDAGLAGASESALLDGFCRRANAAGLPIARGVMIIDTLHPAYEGHAFFWDRHAGQPQTEQIEYGRSDEGERAELWRQSVFFHLLQTGGSQFRVRFHAGETTDFPRLVQLHDDGMSDVVALLTRFSGSDSIGEMDSLYCYWGTDRPQGFADGEVEALVRLMPLLALAVKCVSLAGIAGTLVQTYLGRDAGQRVLRGRIRRGVAEKINAVLWYSDLRDFTGITDRAAPEQIIPFLNDYTEAVISSIYDRGGDVLKLIGDGALAIFASDCGEDACRSAIAAYDLLQDRLARLNRRRTEDAAPTTQIGVGLHIGEVFFGNIGSQERLDFTVVGPAVNEVARIAAMCRSADREVLLSQAFAEAMAKLERGRLVSVGRYALRGVERPQELFTLDPFWTP
ncbi:MAG: adenylate/guanylate cyclase domain-containing protein [Alphaproteobacteria bacterium]